MYPHSSVYGDATMGWWLTNGEMAPYDPTVLRDVVVSLIESKELTPVELKELNDLKVALENYATNKATLDHMAGNI